MDRRRARLGVVVTGVIYAGVVSRLLLVPDDPLGCVSVQAGRFGWLIIPVCGVLAYLLAMMVSWISRAKLEEMGVFAVALGLALASLRYESAGYLWASLGRGDDTLRRELATVMALESVGWFLVVAAAYAGSIVLLRAAKLKPMITANPLEEYRSGALTVVFMSIIAILLLQMLSSGTELAPVQIGQVCFALAMSFYLAALISYQVTGAQSPVWAYLSAVIVAVAGHLWTAMNPTPAFPGRIIAHLVHFSPTAFGRALPIQAIMIATAAAIFGNWHQRQLTRYAVTEDQKPAHTP